MKEYIYNSKGYYILNEDSLKMRYKITVVTPVYNAEKFLRDTIDSVISQDIGFNNIQYILVDDGSADSSREILAEYAEKFKNIIPVFLENNTGTPAYPRNLGIELANSEYVIFLDADDKLATKGVRTLAEILDETGDVYVVGKTIKVESGGSKIVGPYNSCKERRKVSPYTIPNVFGHLGPTARMMSTKFIKDNNILFPSIRYSEDKQFFMNVIIKCNTMSTTTEVIYYTNRLDENNTSLTTRTSLIEKMDTNIALIEYIKDKKLDEEIEKLALNRLYEFDCMTRLFFRKHYLKSEDKQLYYDKFKEVIATTENLRYPVSEVITTPMKYIIFNLCCEEKYEQVEKIVTFEINEKNKKYIVKDKKPYVIVNTVEDEYKYIPVSMIAFYESMFVEEDRARLRVVVYGDYVNKIDNLTFEKRNDYYDETGKEFKKIAIKNNYDGKLEIEMDLEFMSSFQKGGYKTYLIYNEYETLYILKDESIVVPYNDVTLEFYRTIKKNFSLKVL